MTDPHTQAIHNLQTTLAQKMGIPVPTKTPQELMQEVLAMRNEWKLYKRKCDATGKDILSAYPPDSPFTVYSNAIWWGDTWDAQQYARDYDFSKPFFEQFAQLQKVVPREGTTVFNSENCDYNGHIRESKNCYLNALAVKCENVYYSYWTVSGKDVFDSYLSTNSTLCYECIDVENAYECVALHESSNCNNCYFSYQLKGCDHCLFSTNLVNKSYHIFNKPCTPQEFEEAKKKYLNGSWSAWIQAKQQFEEIKSKTIHRATRMLKCENCTGDHLYTSKNCHDCYDTFESEDCYNAISADHSKDIQNCCSAGWPACEMVHTSCVTRGSVNIAYCSYTWFSNNLRYCDSCVSCENCFGCIGLRHKKYCILNKQYTKEEYETLMPKIIEHLRTPVRADEGSRNNEWGNFFPHVLTPYGYNETAAQQFFPLSKEKATALGWKWRDADKKEYMPATIPQIQDSTHDLPETITKEILACELCGKNYRLIPQEVAFYKNAGLPVPRFCPECRHKNRSELRNPYQLWNRSCMRCNAEIQSTFAPDRPETIYCEKCYLKDVY